VNCAMGALPLIAWFFKRVECELCDQQMLEALRNNPLVFLTSIPDTIVEYQHGLVIVTAFAKDASLRSAYLLGWCARPSWSCHVITLLHLSGAYVVTMLVSTFSQFCEVVSRGETPEENDSEIFQLKKIACNAKIAGFGIIRNRATCELHDASDIVSLHITALMTLLLLSNIPYLFWQTSMAMADPHHSAVTTMAMLLSLSCGMKQVGEATTALYAGGDIEDRILGFIFIVCCAGLLILMFARAIASYVCPDGEWGVVTGCVTVVNRP